MTIHCSGVSCSMEFITWGPNYVCNDNTRIAIMQLSLILIKLCLVHRLILIDFQSLVLSASCVLHLISLFLFLWNKYFLFKIVCGLKETILHALLFQFSANNPLRKVSRLLRSAGVKCEWFAWPTVLCVSVIIVINTSFKSDPIRRISISPTGRCRRLNSDAAQTPQLLRKVWKLATENTNTCAPPKMSMHDSWIFKEQGWNGRFRSCFC